MAVLVRIVLCVAALMVASPAPAAEVSGRARVLDGDTVEIQGMRIRLYGIDAPESAQRCGSGREQWACGREATAALRNRVSGRTVRCLGKERDRYGRLIAVCHAGGVDVNGWMVSEGWALASRRYSRTYVEHEAAARSARRGIWRGKFVTPWDWRRGVPTTKATSAGRDCRIKGNIGRDGARIYHIPGGRYYERTRITPSRGEQWFCSEAEARAAGWQRGRH